MRRSLGEVAKASSSFPRCLKQGEGDKEKTTVKKSPPHEVPLIHGVVPRFSDRRRLWPSAKNATKKKPSRRLAVRGRRCPRFSLFLFRLPCFFPSRSQANTAR
ncbi:hypothetical protein B296_00048045 [Ensete ventricosum]|uniref:Uncharacterized protein n=1 Tax=Ensete ventricosum TaxID=4639 RepID=A0A426XJA3_ENSVE|nr:hypothetical protein B296_00048045 [Ensete ventricosum]